MFAAVAVLLSGTLVLVGCSSTADEPSQPATPAAESPTVAPSTSEPAPPPPPEPLSVTIAAAGDILTHPPVSQSATNYAGGSGYDYSPMFTEVAPLLSAAQLAICHLETPLSPDNTNLSEWGSMSFNTPHEMATALAGAGYDGCEFASNHTMDRGLAGLGATEQVVRDAGMGYAGPTANQDRAGIAEFYELAGATVAHLAYTYTYPNDWGPTTVIPQEAPWLVESSWPSIGSAGIRTQAQAAKDAGADFVVVSLHWGNEYQAMPADYQTTLAHEVMASDEVDLILGTHVHVVQPCEVINGRHVIYGMGNSLSNQSPMTASGLLPETQDGMVATFTLNKDPDGVVTTQMSYQPTFVEMPGHMIRLVSPESNPASWQRTTAAVDLLGGCGAEVMQP